MSPEQSATTERRQSSVNRRPLGLAGALVIYIFTVVALSPAFVDLHVSSFSFSAVIAGMSGCACWTVALLYGRLPRRAAYAAAPFAAFIAAMLISLLLGTTARQGVQFIMVQVATLSALLVAATARSTVGDYLEIQVGRCIRFTSIVFGTAATLNSVGIGFAIGGTRTSAIVGLIAISWFLAEYKSGHPRSLWWALAILLEIAITLSRTATLASFVLLLACLMASRKKRLRNSILCILLMATGFWAVTSWAPLHDRFVQGDTSLSIGGVNINAEGRTKAWTVLWGEIPDHLVIGHGPGTASARSLSVVPGLDHPHNDYLRILYDFGVVGFGLFIWFVVRAARLLRASRRRAPQLIAALAALNAGLAILIMMLTDNPLDYSYIMIPLGALIGLALGQRKAQPRSNPAAAGSSESRA